MSRNTDPAGFEQIGQIVTSGQGGILAHRVIFNKADDTGGFELAADELTEKQMLTWMFTAVQRGETVRCMSMHPKLVVYISLVQGYDHNEVYEGFAMAAMAFMMTQGVDFDDYAA